MIVFVRGLLGSGKTTFVKRNFKKSFHIEADMFHMKNGNYEFSLDKADASHDWCFELFKKSIESGLSDIVISNRFTQYIDIERYLNVCRELKKDFTIYRMNSEFKSIHNVPEDVMIKMRAEFEDIENEVNI
jgi:predicted kinase